jgi:predicted RNA-binding Zn-ribbon protein involved in translation (DUF1610 family)
MTQTEEKLALNVQCIEDYMKCAVEHVESDQEWYLEFECPYCNKALCDHILWDGDNIIFETSPIKTADFKCPECGNMIDIVKTYVNYAVVLQTKSKDFLDRANELSFKATDDETETNPDRLKRQLRQKLDSIQHELNYIKAVIQMYGITI